jgi:hypothetical protein
MKKIVALTIMVFAFLSFAGCPPTMERVYNDFRIHNNSAEDIKILLNLNYPDTSFENTIPDRYLEAGENGYVGNFYNIKNMSGLTVFVFGLTYYTSQWHPNSGRPHQFLSEDSAKASYILSITQLDSMSWVLEFD